MHIRPMTAEDLEQVIEIASGLKDAPHWPRHAYLTLLDADSLPRRLALVAAEAGGSALAGFAVASQVGTEAELETIAVASVFQRRGVGRLLMVELMAALGAQGAATLRLEVRASNSAALGLYRALGFESSGRRPRYYASPVEDAVLLALILQ